MPKLSSLSLTLVFFLSSRVRSMPELPEVESARKHLALHCKGRRIIEVITREQGHGPRHGLFDDIIFEQEIPEDVKDRYTSQLIAPSKTGKKSNKLKNNIEDSSSSSEDIYQRLLTNSWAHQISRKGKQLWIELGEEPESTSNKSEKLSLLIHFGMTGSIVVKNQKIPSYRSFNVVENEKWPPRFAKLELVFSNTDDCSESEPIRVALCDPRRLGSVKLRISPLDTLPIKSLALDPLTDTLPPVSMIKDQLSKCSTNIKTLLLNQEKLFSGIGNYLADEILYQAKIHPLTIASEINEEGLSMLVTKMKEIISTAVNCDADYEQFPRDWIFHYRWEKGKADGVRHMPNGNHITYETINGRTTAIVTKEQLKDGYYKILTSASAVTTKVTKSSNGSNKRKSEMLESEIDTEISLEANGKKSEVNESEQTVVSYRKRRIIKSLDQEKSTLTEESVKETNRRSGRIKNKNVPEK